MPLPNKIEYITDLLIIACRYHKKNNILYNGLLVLSRASSTNIFIIHNTILPNSYYGTRHLTTYLHKYPWLDLELKQTVQCIRLYKLLTDTGGQSGLVLSPEEEHPPWARSTAGGS